MVEKEEDPYGYTYRATNIVNDKYYFGQTTTSRWNESKIPIEERWKEEVREAYSRAARGENLRYIEKAIIKYGPENFELRQEDKAYNQKELDRKETEHIRDYDSMNPDKGYNMTEGGEGGRMSEMAKEKMSESGSEKWQNDLEYREKQTKERQERAEKNPDWAQKMTEINQEIARNPKVQEKISKVLTEKWQDTKYQESVSNGVTDKWKDEKYRERQARAKTEGKREIPDKAEFLKDITEMPKKDIITKYDMDGKSINKRIEEMLKHQDVRTYSEAKKFLEDKNIQNVVKDIEEKLSNERKPDFIQKMTEINRERAKDPQWLAKMREINKQYRKEIPDKREFLQEIKESVPKKELLQKHDMGGKALNRRVQEMFGPDGPKNYTELKQYLQDRNVNDVLKEVEERTKEKEGKKETKTEETKGKGESKPQEIVKEKSEVEPKKDEKEGKVEPTKEDNKEINPEKEAEVSDKEKELEDKEGNKGVESKNEEKITEEPKQEEKDYAGIDEGILGENSPEKKGDIDGAFESSIIRGNDFINIIDPKTKERGSKEIIGKDTRFTSGVHVIGKKFVNPPKPMGREDKHSDFSGLNINLNIDGEHADMSISGGGGGGGGSEGDGKGGYSLDYGTIDDDDKEEFTTTEQEGEGSSEGRGRSWEV